MGISRAEGPCRESRRSILLCLLLKLTEIYNLETATGGGQNVKQASTSALCRYGPLGIFYIIESLQGQFWYYELIVLVHNTVAS